METYELIKLADPSAINQDNYELLNRLARAARSDYSLHLLPCVDHGNPAVTLIIAFSDGITIPVIMGVSGARRISEEFQSVIHEAQAYALIETMEQEGKKK